MALLKELVASKLIEPSWISIEKSQEETYQLKIRSISESSEITQFFVNNNLVVKEKNGFWLISKP